MDEVIFKHINILFKAVASGYEVKIINAREALGLLMISEWKELPKHGQHVYDADNSTEGVALRNTIVHIIIFQVIGVP